MLPVTEIIYSIFVFVFPPRSHDPARTYSNTRETKAFDNRSKWKRTSDDHVYTCFDISTSLSPFVNSRPTRFEKELAISHGNFTSFARSAFMDKKNLKESKNFLSFSINDFYSSLHVIDWPGVRTTIMQKFANRVGIQSVYI